MVNYTDLNLTDGRSQEKEKRDENSTNSMIRDSTMASNQLKRSRKEGNDETWTEVTRNSKKRNTSLSSNDQLRPRHVANQVSVTCMKTFPRQFALAKLLKENGISGVLKVKYVNQYKLLLNFETAICAEKFMSCEVFSKMSWKRQKTSEIGVSYGLIKDIDLDITDEELIQNISSEYKIVSAKRLNRRSLDGWIPSTSFRFGFDGPTLPRMFPLRQAVNTARWVVPSIRCMSAKSGPLVDVTVDNEGYATVTLQRPPVNSLNLEFLQEINKSLDEVGKNKCKGMILTSISPTVFSAGLDIMEMYKPDIKRAETFWTTLQDMWLKLYGSAYPTAAAINGHAPAGGCLIAMSCEYRVMVNGKYNIGLNETALGIVAPRWFMDSINNTISRREAEFALTTARMFSVDEALKVGLIDEVATDKADSVEKCKKFLKKYERIPPLARAITKQRYRESALNWLIKNREQDLNEFMAFLKNPKVQQSLEMYIQSLKQKSK